MAKKSWKNVLRILLAVLFILGSQVLAQPTASPSASPKASPAVSEEKVPDLTIEEILIDRNLNSQQTQEINIRVNAVNTGEVAFEKPSLSLWVRESEEQDWRLLKSWQDNPPLEVGERMSRDYFALGTLEADPALLSPFFQVKAEIRSGEYALDRQAVHLDQSVATP